MAGCNINQQYDIRAMSKDSKEESKKRGFHLSDNWLMTIGVVLGVLGGWAYWEIVGCPTGACPIYSTSITYILLGGAVGGLLFGFVGDIRSWVVRRREDKS